MLKLNDKIKAQTANNKMVVSDMVSKSLCQSYSMGGSSYKNMFTKVGNGFLADTEELTTPSNGFFASSLTFSVDIANL